MTAAARVLVVDDVPAVIDQYAYDLQRLGGYEVLRAPGGREAVAILDTEAVDCIVLDLEMPGLDGFGVLRALAEREIDIPVVVYTGTGNYDRCAQAIRLGAAAFIDKGDAMERVVREIENALERHRLAGQVRSLRRQLGAESALLGSSPPMQQLREAIARLAPIPSPVLIVGESGSGKELAARDLHQLGPRAPEPYVPVNCAALPEALVESELFGHERGAFTGAHRTRRGAFETAGRGTLFLDEIGELPLPAQAKLLRVLEDGRATRVGGERPLQVRCRVVAATNRDLEREVAAGRFRQDLHYRLNVHIVRVPALRERLSDLPELASHLLESACARLGVRAKRLAPETLQLLLAYDWAKNNVRELRNVVERMAIAADGERIEPAHVPADIRGGELPPVTAPATDHGGRTLRELKAEAERQILVAALQRNDWHVSKTAQELGLADHSSLLKIMRRHGLRSRS
jgi:two-component system, NtrC family, nitrogen regulation response regulator NtrX